MQRQIQTAVSCALLLTSRCGVSVARFFSFFFCSHGRVFSAAFGSPADGFLEWGSRIDAGQQPYALPFPPHSRKLSYPRLIKLLFSRTGWTATQCTTPKQPGLSPDVSSVPEPKTMGYGFDDGPNCTHNAFYDYLASQNQKATLYYIGSNVMDWPLEAQRGIADGHEICARECWLVSSMFFPMSDLFSSLWRGRYLVTSLQ